MQQIAVRRVDLDEFETGLDGTARGRLEGIDDGFDARFVQCFGHGRAFVEGDRAWRYDGPASLLGCLQSATAEPGRFAAGFASGRAS